MQFAQFQAMLQDNGLRLTFTPDRAASNHLRGALTPDRMLFEKMIRAHADNLGRLSRDAKMSGMGADEDVSVTSPGPWSASLDAIGCRQINDIAGQQIGYTTGLSDDAQDFANAVMFQRAFEMRGKLRRLTAAAQAVLSSSSSLIETQVAARDALFVMTKDAISLLEQVYPSREDIEKHLAETPPTEIPE